MKTVLTSTILMLSLNVMSNTGIDLSTETAFKCADLASNLIRTKKVACVDEFETRNQAKRTHNEVRTQETQDAFNEAEWALGDCINSVVDSCIEIFVK